MFMKQHFVSIMSQFNISQNADFLITHYNIIKR